jgi:PAS domain S-box-containing protein
VEHVDDDVRFAMTMTQPYSRMLRRVVVVYVLLGGAWILFSDRALEALALSPETEAWVQTVKGWFFVAMSAVALFALLRSSLLRIGAAEAALDASREHYRHLLDGLPDAVWEVRGGTIVFANPAAGRLTGVESTALVGRPLASLVAESDRHGLLAFLAEARAGAVRVATVVDTEENEHPVEFAALPLPGSGGAMVLVGRDMGVRQQLEEQLRQSQKMEAVGRLASTVAHDFNNLLTSILGHAQLATLRTHDPAYLQDELAQIRRTAERGALLTRRLLAFTRRQVVRLRLLELHEVVHDLERMLRRLIGEEVELMIEAEPSSGCVMADPSQLEQIVMNLAVNARDAMPAGGTLRIATSAVELDDEAASRMGVAKSGPYAVLTVQDTGTGMDASTLARIFEPFFTTKEEGKGTGLGLATVRGIVQDCGGYVEVKSEIERGSTFRVYLPRVRGPGAVPTPMRPGDQSLMIGSETILLVEDDEPLRRLARRALFECGYQVLEAATGPDAIDVSSSYDGPIDLLLTDAVLPQTRLSEMLAVLKEQRPHMRVLFISGYSDEALARQGISARASTFLHKPFSPSELSRKVRRVLADGPRTRV